MSKTISTTATSLALFAAMTGCGGGDATSNVGTGSNPAAWQFRQGDITVTNNPLDVAIQGAGLFQLDNANSPPMYARRGSFLLDQEGYIVTEMRLRLLVRRTNAQGIVQAGAAVPAQLPTGYVAPTPTTTIQMGLNLDANKSASFSGNGPAISFDDAATFNNAISIAVYDAKGVRIAMTFFFQKASTDLWNVYATANGVSVAGDNSAPLAIATLKFPESGVAPTQPTWPVLLNIPATTNSDGDLTVAMAGVQLDLSKATEFGSAFGVSLIKQNGFMAGLLTGLSFEPNGMLLGFYSNGQTIPVGQIELATFTNMLCLQSGGSNLWFAGQDCGQPLTGAPGSGFFNLVEPGALEAL